MSEHTAEICLRKNGENVIPEYQCERMITEGLKKFFFDYLNLEPCDGLTDTPHRYLKALKEMTSGYKQVCEEILDVTFDSSYDELIIVRDIPFTSLCEHHLYPFVGTVTIGYIPSGGKIAGLSKFPRLVQALAHRLQVQERLTSQISETIQKVLTPQGVGVIIRAVHSCMRCRGIRSTGEMVTSSLTGVIREHARDEFLTLTAMR